MALATLKSLYRFLSIKYPLEIHDDGSLTASDIKLLETSFLGVKIIVRQEADRIINEYYLQNNFSNLKKFREKANVNLQSTDLAFFCKTRYCLQVDTDILFFNNPYFLEPDFIEQLIKNGSVNSFYNVDRGPAYSYSSEDMERYLNKSIPYQFNAGLVLFPNKKIVFKYLEEILSHGLISKNNWTQSQTVQCMALQKLGDCFPMLDTVDVSYRMHTQHPTFDANLYSSLVAEHYCAWARNLYYLDYIEKVHPFVKVHSGYREYFYNLINH
ncbi:hypothetical protein [Hufsiella arboris]|nr:hypothetical protein [Hufsiella arboris]